MIYLFIFLSVTISDFRGWEKSDLFGSQVFWFSVCAFFFFFPQPFPIFIWNKTVLTKGATMCLALSPLTADSLQAEGKYIRTADVVKPSKCWLQKVYSATMVSLAHSPISPLRVWQYCLFGYRSLIWCACNLHTTWDLLAPRQLTHAVQEAQHAC